MNRLQKSGNVLAVIALLAATTNPNEKAYAEHVVSKFQDTVCRQKELPITTKVPCYTIRVLPRSISKRMLASYSQQQNYVFFSVYTTEFFGLRDCSVGIGSFFL